MPTTWRLPRSGSTEETTATASLQDYRPPLPICYILYVELHTNKEGSFICPAFPALLYRVKPFIFYFLLFVAIVTVGLCTFSCSNLVGCSTRHSSPPRLMIGPPRVARSLLPEQSRSTMKPLSPLPLSLSSQRLYCEQHTMAVFMTSDWEMLLPDLICPNSTSCLFIWVIVPAPPNVGLLCMFLEMATMPMSMKKYDITGF